MVLEYKATFKEGDLINDLSGIINKHSSLSREESLSLAQESVEKLKAYNERYGNKALYDLVLNFVGEIAIEGLKAGNRKNSEVQKVDYNFVKNSLQYLSPEIPGTK